MSEDKAKAAEASEEKPPKSPVVKIVILVVAVVLLMAIAVGATLFATGVFSGKPHDDEDALVEEGGHGEAKGGHGAAKKTRRRRRKQFPLTKTLVLKKAIWTWMKKSRWWLIFPVPGR